MLNEEEHIERVISGFLDSGYPNLTEILVADGGSTDKTRQIVIALGEKEPRIKLIGNAEKYQSFGLNKMIEVAEGEIFLRADGHCFYADNYIEKCVETLLETGAKNVGGAQRYKASNYVQAGIALAVKSFLGNGGAKYMDINYNGYADTVFLGCFWTKDLQEIGGFNTENVTNQDSELNLRFIEKFGECIYINSEIKSWYFPRESFGKLFEQYIRYGRGRFLTRVLHPENSPLRGMAPFISLLLLAVFGITDLFTQVHFYTLEILIGLAIIVLFESLRLSISKSELFKRDIWESKTKAPGFLNRALSSSITIVLMQVGHFLGFLFQLLRKIIIRVKGW
ncbi:MAG: glycosyltransferase family 2 protein [Balneolaceae bacterium]|nr:glycosyltransferase family 2 protein [Balneolaceae bacterium]MBO6545296.1 glycosyltransferase family 2 protein [Balneolaceae bacterium]MBO6646692.1 glycosyltransferase family 2 protein [Balneolaceae bacterium]